jgi:hypothetical protein
MCIWSRTCWSDWPKSSECCGGVVWKEVVVCGSLFSKDDRYCYILSHLGVKRFLFFRPILLLLSPKVLVTWWAWT